ncbi:unnamed protein product [Microthlaspi erraticum]|uniref:Uncharacterized protein n=1 Tax=Microthlaspi erraticum TaxID=1685480 RepID=A0A6D2J3X9_9BRAS|nr:unnamed protein product [Microthlaspi erraticum]
MFELVKPKAFSRNNMKELIIANLLLRRSRALARRSQVRKLSLNESNENLASTFRSGNSGIGSCTWTRYAEEVAIYFGAIKGGRFLITRHDVPFYISKRLNVLDLSISTLYTENTFYPLFYTILSFIFEIIPGKL